MASFLESNFGFEFGAKTCLFWSLWQIISAWLVLEAAGCEQSGLSLLYCGSTSMIPAAKLWNKSLATGCSMMVYPWVDTCRLPGFKTMQRKVPTWHRKTGVWSLLLAWWHLFFTRPFVCNALFLFLLLYFHMYKPQTNLVNVCTQLISLRNEHEESYMLRCLKNGTLWLYARRTARLCEHL